MLWVYDCVLEAEGLRLHLSSTSATGYMGTTWARSISVMEVHRRRKGVRTPRARLRGGRAAAAISSSSAPSRLRSPSRSGTPRDRPSRPASRAAREPSRTSAHRSHKHRRLRRTAGERPDEKATSRARRGLRGGLPESIGSLQHLTELGSEEDCPSRLVACSTSRSWTYLGILMLRLCYACGRAGPAAAHAGQLGRQPPHERSTSATN